MTFFFFFPLRTPLPFLSFLFSVFQPSHPPTSDIVPGLILVRLAKDQLCPKGGHLLFWLRLLPSLDSSIWNFGRRGKLRKGNPFHPRIRPTFWPLVFINTTYFGILPNQPPHAGKNRYLCLSSAFSSTYFQSYWCCSTPTLSLPLLDLFSPDPDSILPGPYRPVCATFFTFTMQPNTFLSLLVSVTLSLTRPPLGWKDQGGPWARVAMPDAIVNTYQQETALCYFSHPLAPKVLTTSRTG